MSDYEIKEALQLRQQRFEAALRFATTSDAADDYFMDIDDAIKMADELIKKLEAPTIVKEDVAF